MRHRRSITVLAFLCLALFATGAQGQILSPCLRPLGIPDKWVENQTPPWDPADTFDPTGPNPDVYQTGFEPLTDQGLPMALVLYHRVEPLQGRSASPVVVSQSGGIGFYQAIVACSGYPHAIGDTFPLASGNLAGPFSSAMEDLISLDTRRGTRRRTTAVVGSSTARSRTAPGSLLYRSSRRTPTPRARPCRRRW